MRLALIDQHTSKIASIYLETGPQATKLLADYLQSKIDSGDLALHIKFTDHLLHDNCCWCFMEVDVGILRTTAASLILKDFRLRVNVLHLFLNGETNSLVWRLNWMRLVEEAAALAAILWTVFSSRACLLPLLAKVMKCSRTRYPLPIFHIQHRDLSFPLGFQQCALVVDNTETLYTRSKEHGGSRYGSHVTLARLQQPTSFFSPCFLLPWLSRAPSLTLQICGNDDSWLARRYGWACAQLTDANSLQRRAPSS